MIAEAGLAALWIAAALAGLQIVLAALVIARGDAEVRRSVRPLAVVQGLAAAAAMALLIALFVNSDMSVLLVAENSHSAKPLIYKIAGAWGNHEGSMLLWVTILGIAGAAVALLEHRLDDDTLIATLGSQAAIALGFYAFLLFASNPFARIAPAPADGNGLNPLLQDPGLAFHPPTLYIGYVGISVAFSFAVGAMVTGRIGPAFARAMRPWVLGAWIFLTLGITAGSYWSYYILGWGGWWFWDPVENASFMPWLIGTALVHSAIVMEKRGALVAWTIFLAITAFLLSLLGTFLVRSGALTSVHAFALDPERGAWLLGGFFLAGIGGYGLFFWRADRLAASETHFEPVSREGALVFNNLFLMFACATILAGTLYPLILEALSGRIVSIGAPFFNATFSPLSAVLLLVLPIGVLIPWKRGRIVKSMRKLFVVAGLAFLITLAIIGLYRPSMAHVLGLFLGLWLVMGAGRDLWSRLAGAKSAPSRPGVKLGAAPFLARLVRLPAQAWASVLGHAGLGVFVLGAIASTAFHQELNIALAPGEPVEFAGYRLQLTKMIARDGPNYYADQAILQVRDDQGRERVLKPERRFYPVSQMPTTETAIWSSLRGDLYIAMGDGAPEEGLHKRRFRIYLNPLIGFVYGGVALIALAGFVALFGLSVGRPVFGARRRPADEPEAAHPAPAFSELAREEPALSELAPGAALIQPISPGITP